MAERVRTQWKLPKLHKSHRMTKWKHTIVQISNTPRFGRFRSCKNCGAEQAVTVAGQGTHEELLRKCNG